VAVIDVATASGAGLPAAHFQMTTGESWPLAVNFADLISTASGDAPSGASCAIVDTQTGRSISAALSSAPALTTATWTVTQTLLGSALEGGHSYDMLYGLTANASKKVRVRLRVEVLK